MRALVDGTLVDSAQPTDAARKVGESLQVGQGGSIWKLTMHVKLANGEYKWEDVCGCSQCKPKFDAAFECSASYDFVTSKMKFVGRNEKEVTVQVYYNITT